MTRCLCGCSTDLHPSTKAGKRGPVDAVVVCRSRSKQANGSWLSSMTCTVTLPACWTRHAKITVHGGKTKVWNSAGERPEACHELERVARLSDPEAIVWRGWDSCGSTRDQGVGSTHRHPEFVRRQLETVSQEHQTLLSRIPHVQDTQCAWLLLVHCASASKLFVESHASGGCGGVREQTRCGIVAMFVRRVGR